ncbi:MAG: DUF4347 domain-containing protein, partial [Alkalinema sp. RU_4_3]|nr:DUF4347 domain-containing protein [Alkalinema sp. RU_4_3]
MTKTAQNDVLGMDTASLLIESDLSAPLTLSTSGAPDSGLSALPNADRLVILDKSVEGWQNLAQGTLSGSDVYVIDPTRDGLTQIGEILGFYNSVKNLHIVSHGNAGSFTLAGRSIDASNLNSNQLAWRDRFTDDADILLYGCNIAADSSGLNFIKTLGDLTGADVAASVDLTGATAAGGNWILEANYGQIESNLAFTEARSRLTQAFCPTLKFNIQIS